MREREEWLLNARKLVALATTPTTILDKLGKPILPQGGTSATS
jgi:hypothetical protein